MPARRHIHELLAAKIAGGSTLKDAASELGISAMTARRRMADPAFRDHVARLRRDLASQAIGKLAEAMVHSVDELRRLTSSSNEGIRLRACIALLDHALKAVALADLEERIQAVESRLAHANTASTLDQDRSPTG